MNRSFSHVISHVSCLAALLCLATCVVNSAELPAPNPKVSPAYGRNVDHSANWQQVGGDLIKNFNNMYHLCILKEPGQAYPYKGWFFGWASTTANTNYGYKFGCDMAFAARAKQLAGPWEIYAGDDKWDTTMNPKTWIPVLVAQGKFYNSWHNGDSSVVKVGAKYYMAYSSTGFNKDMIPFGQPGDTDSDINCIMGAVSEDGINWTPTSYPILIDPRNIGQKPERPGEYMHPYGIYHRPSLMREGKVWRLWFDCWTGKDMPMGYAENHGDFMNPSDWKILRGIDNPVLENYPNPDVVKIKGVYFAYSDPGGYTPLMPTYPSLQAKFLKHWASRKICESVSLNGLDWVPLGFIERDSDGQANQVPVAYVEKEGDASWIYVNYGLQVFGDYRQDRIRMKRRLITDKQLADYRRLWLSRYPATKPR